MLLLLVCIFVGLLGSGWRLDWSFYCCCCCWRYCGCCWFVLGFGGCVWYCLVWFLLVWLGRWCIFCGVLLFCVWCVWIGIFGWLGLLYWYGWNWFLVVLYWIYGLVCLCLVLLYCSSCILGLGWDWICWLYWWNRIGVWFLGVLSVWWVVVVGSLGWCFFVLGRILVLVLLLGVGLVWCSCLVFVVVCCVGLVCVVGWFWCSSCGLFVWWDWWFMVLCGLCLGLGVGLCLNLMVRLVCSSCWGICWLWWWWRCFWVGVCCSCGKIC